MTACIQPSIRLWVHPSTHLLKFTYQCNFFLNSFNIFNSREDIQEISKANKNQNNQNRFIPLSEGVISCAAHPLYNAIVAGTKVCGLENAIIFIIFRLKINYDILMAKVD